MGLAVCYRDGNVAKYGLENALLPVDTILLEVVAPFKDGTTAGRFIERTGREKSGRNDGVACHGFQRIARDLFPKIGRAHV